MKKIDLKVLEKLGSLQCTFEEIASFFDINPRTIYRHMKEEDGKFAAAYKRGVDKGKISLRRLQWKAAQGVEYIAYFCDRKQKYSLMPDFCEKKKASDMACQGCSGLREGYVMEFKSGATGMQIWLGKQWLGQKEKFEHTVPDGIPLKIDKNMSPQEAARIYAQTVKKGK